MPLFDFIADKNSSYGGGGSTDVGDVSWVVPAGTGLHKLPRSRRRRLIPGRPLPRERPPLPIKACWRRLKSWPASAYSF